MSDNNYPEINLTHSWKKFSLLIIFLTITPATLIISILTLSVFSNSKNNSATEVLAISDTYSERPNLYSPLPSTFPGIAGEVVGSDARTKLIKKYLDHYNSPLSQYADKIIFYSDKYKVDYKLITAIAQQESNLCKFAPDETYNCWGWGIHSRGTLGFSSYEEGIETVIKGLKEEYLNKGYLTPEEIMSKYTPLSNGSWAKGVNQFLTNIETSDY